MMELSVMWISTGHTSVQHLVMLQNPTPPRPSLRYSKRLSVSLGCISSHWVLTKKRGPANSGCLWWVRKTWQTSWHIKHSMHFLGSYRRCTSSSYISNGACSSVVNGFIEAETS